MKVILLSHTPEPERLVASAARMSVSCNTADGAYSEFTGDKIEKRVSSVLSDGDLSFLEHISYSFSVEGLSENALSDLALFGCKISRQRIKSLRTIDPADFVIPERIVEDESLLESFKAAASSAAQLYEKLLRNGISADDASYALPMALPVNLLITMTAAGMLKFFSEKCCKKTPWELRSLAWKMLRAALKESPAIFRTAGPECFSSGRCPWSDIKCFAKMKRVWSDDLTDK